MGWGISFVLECVSYMVNFSGVTGMNVFAAVTSWPCMAVEQAGVVYLCGQEENSLFKSCYLNKRKLASLKKIISVCGVGPLDKSTCYTSMQLEFGPQNSSKTQVWLGMRVKHHCRVE